MSLRFLTAGESHGPELLIILDGFPAGLKLNAENINADLARRQLGYDAGPRMKLETDQAQISAGVMDNRTTGAPIAIRINNADHDRWLGKKIPPMTIPRPGHVDLAAAIKYGYNDLRPGLERASARETAARVAAGAVCRTLLAEFGIKVGGYVTGIGSICDTSLDIPIVDRINAALKDAVHCSDLNTSLVMQHAIHEAMLAKDTLGGIIEVVALGLPAGLGSFAQWDRKLDSRIAAAILSVPAIKGVEFGAAFENASKFGTQVQDAIRLHERDIIRPTQNDGGLEGGVTTGQPLIIRAAMKPIPSTLTPQLSVDLVCGEEVMTKYERSDFCPVPRAVVILEAMLAFVLTDALIEKLGGDSISEMKARFEKMAGANLDDLQMDGQEHFFWPE
jgi:chorismate synthase